MSVPMDAIPGPGELLNAFCLRCGYSLRGLPASGEGLCPECGKPAERMPMEAVFACEAPPRRYGLPARRAAAAAIGLTVLAYVAFLVWFVAAGAVAERSVHFLIPAVLFTVILLPVVVMSVIFLWPRRRPAPRIVVDCARRCFRFEWCNLERPWRPPATTGEGMEVGFGEVRGVAFWNNACLTIMVPAGRVIIWKSYSNFPALAAVVYEVVSDTSPYWGRPWFRMVIGLAIPLPIAGIILLGAWLGWW